MNAKGILCWICFDILYWEYRAVVKKEKEERKVEKAAAAAPAPSPAKLKIPKLAKKHKARLPRRKKKALKKALGRTSARVESEARAIPSMGLGPFMALPLIELRHLMQADVPQIVGLNSKKFVRQIIQGFQDGFSDALGPLELPDRLEINTLHSPELLKAEPTFRQIKVRSLPLEEVTPFKAEMALVEDNL